MTATPTTYRLLRDVPIGRRGRLLVFDRDEQGRFVLVYYRGTNPDATALVLARDVEMLRDLFDRRQDVERRVGQRPDLRSAVATALDLPLVDRECVRVTEYLASVQGWPS